METILNTAKKSKKNAALAIAGIAGAALVVGAGCASPSNAPQQTSDAGSGDAGSAAPSAPAATASYKDGSYEAMGGYRSPAGPEQIDVKLTLKDNVITSLTVVPQATMPKSVHFQGLFTSGVNAEVVGKNINDVNLTWVSGSSLTPKGFNDALAKIKAQAAS